MRLLCKMPLVGLSVLSIGSFFFVALQRLGYRYELDWLESGLVEHVRRFNDGLALYNEPSVDFVQFPYPPVYIIVSSPVAQAVGDGFLALRLVSFAATIATLGLLVGLVTFETGKRWAGLVAAGVYAATYGYVGTWFEVAKIDSLFIALTLAAVFVLRKAETNRSLVLAGALFALAVLTKQTALIIAFPVVLYLLVVRRRQSLPFVASLLGVVGVVSALMHVATDGWSTYFVWRQLLGHSAIPSDRFAFWTTDAAVFLPGLFVVILALPFWRQAKRRFAFGLYASALAGSIAGAWASRLHEGGFANVLMPICLMAAVFIGCSLPALVDDRRLWVMVPATLLTLFQFQSLAYSPTSALPSKTDALAGKALIQRLREIDGDVLLTSHPTYGVYAGKPAHAQQGGTNDVLRSDDQRARNTLRRSYAEAIYSGRFAAIVLDSPGDAGAFPADWKAHYRQVPFTEIPKGDLVPKASETSVPSELWLRGAEGRDAG